MSISEFRGKLISKDVENVMKADKSGTYDALILKYRTSKGKELMDRIPMGYLTKAAALKAGVDSINIGDKIRVVKDTSTKPWKIKEIALDDGLRPQASTGSQGSTGQVRKSDPDVQAAIIRQNALTNAVTYTTGLEVTVEQVIEVAQKFEKYTSGQLAEAAARGELLGLMDGD